MEQSPPIYSGAGPAEVAADLAPLLEWQEEGLPTDELASLMERSLVPHLLRYGLPTFQSMFNAEPEPAARLGAEIALAYNQGVTNWQVSPGGAMLEELCGRALCRLFGLDAAADATFMYSGTYANQQALYLALHRHAQRAGVDLAQQGLAPLGDLRRLRVLISQDAHFSMRHAVRMLGLGEQSLVIAPVDANRRLDVAKTRALVRALPASHRLVCVVATAGTTSTGAVDPIAPLAELAAEHLAWLHVDGAYGYAYKLAPDWAPLFAGDHLADSITWDPHKQLGVPIPNSLLFLRNGQDFGRMALFSGYFNRAEDEEPNPGLKSPPSTRPLAALPLVATLRGRGLAQVVADLTAHLVAIRELGARLATLPDIVLYHRPDTGILCFRVQRPDLPARDQGPLQRYLYDRIMATGRRTISTTALDGETALRLVTVSAGTTVDDLYATVEMARSFAPDFQPA